MDNIIIPDGFDYMNIESISSESRENLMRVLPETLGQASRIGGVRPTDISILAIHLSTLR